MSYINSRVQIVLGNLQSRLRGTVPGERLDQVLNGWGSRRGAEEAEAPFRGASANPNRPGHPASRVYRPEARTVLTGALPRLKQALRREGLRYRILDLRTRPRPRLVFPPSPFGLRAYQETVVESALERGMGVIDIGTGGGKTLIAAELIRRIGRPALYLVTTRALLQQAVRNLTEYLGLAPGVIGAGVIEPRPVTVALVQSLIQDGRDLSWWRDGTVVFDEGHHSCAPSYLSLLLRIDARFNYFLSAVPFRSGSDQRLLDGLTGGSLTDGAFSAAYLIENGYAAPVQVRVEPVSIRGDMLEKPFWQLYQEKIVGNAERNARIVTRVAGEMAAGRSTLVLVEQVRHGRVLLEAIGSRGAFVHGGTGKSELRELTGQFATGTLPFLIATVGLFNEGVSIDGIHCVVNAGGLKSRVRVLQMIGRGMRKAPGKSHVLYVDFHDDCETGVFRGHSRQRLAILRSEGFVVPKTAEEFRATEVSEPVLPAWAHVPGTERFIRFDGEGRVVSRGVCLEMEVVPDRYCRKCKQDYVCKEGGRISWHASESRE